MLYYNLIFFYARELIIFADSNLPVVTHIILSQYRRFQLYTLYFCMKLLCTYCVTYLYKYVFKNS